MQFSRLAEHFERLEATPGRLEMTRILVEVLAEAEGPAEVGAVAYLLRGAVAPDWEGIELGLAERLVLRAVADAAGVAGRGEDAVKAAEALYHDVGDLGAAAERLLGQAGGKRQATLFAPEPLGVLEAHARLRAIALSTGPGSQETKQRLLQKLLLEASPREARYLCRAVAGRLRLGVADMTFLDALAAWHLGRGVRSVQEMEAEERAEQAAARARLERAYDACSDLARVAVALAAGGLGAVDAIQVEVGVPLRPMAAERLPSVAEILERHGGRTAVECKYDGLRMQCHVPSQGPVRLFSRRLEELTAQFPDVTAALRTALPGPCIVEGECVAIDPATGRMRPFQELSRRRGRKTGLGDGTGLAAGGLAGMALGGGALGEGAAVADITREIPVVLYLFDCLADAQGTATGRPYEERRTRLAALAGPGAQAEDARVRVAAMDVVADEAAFEAVFQRVVQDGGEGVMAKRLDAPYKAGNRGFDWIKFKADYTALVDTMDLVVVGAFHGRGRRAGWYGALLMACRDPETGRFASVCKLGTGFDDATLAGLKPRFAGLEAPRRPEDVDSTMEPDVWLRPQVVMEVQAAELTLSPVHRAGWGRLRPEAGLAARFPRFSGRWRDDKSPEQATTVEELVALYTQQGRRRSQGTDAARAADAADGPDAKRSAGGTTWPAAGPTTD